MRLGFLIVFLLWWMAPAVAQVPDGYGPPKGFTIVSTATTNSTVIKVGPGYINVFVGGNITATPVYVKFYDVVGAPVCNTSPIAAEYMIPGSTTGALAVVPIPVAHQFNNGIGVCITSGMAFTDTTAVVAGNVLVEVLYN